MVAKVEFQAKRESNEGETEAGMQWVSGRKGDVK